MLLPPWPSHARSQASAPPAHRDRGHQCVAGTKVPSAHRHGRRAWIYGIALNVASEHRRRRMVRRFFGLDDAPEPVAPSGPHAALEQREAEALVQAALDTLAPKKRAVFVLYELEGLTGEEIAEAVACPLKTVWTRLYHARRELEAELAKRVGRTS